MHDIVGKISAPSNRYRQVLKANWASDSVASASALDYLLLLLLVVWPKFFRGGIAYVTIKRLVRSVTCTQSIFVLLLFMIITTT